MKVLSLFSGGGLGDYGLELAGMEIAGQVEIDEYCQKILSLRWPDVPKWRDVREVRGSELPAVDLISGGFPCQDISIAKQNAEGIKGKRSGLWSEYFRLVCELRPKYVLVENVAAMLFRGIDVVLGDLASIGYDAEWEVLSACQFGATHARERLFILAYPNGELGINQRILAWNGETSAFWEKDKKEWCKDYFGFEVRPKTIGGLDIERFKRHCKSEFLRVVDESPESLDRLKICGNGQVSEVVHWIGKRILSHETQRKLSSTGHS